MFLFLSTSVSIEIMFTTMFFFFYVHNTSNREREREREKKKENYPIERSSRNIVSFSIYKKMVNESILFEQQFALHTSFSTSPRFLSPRCLVMYDFKNADFSRKILKNKTTIMNFFVSKGTRYKGLTLIGGGRDGSLDEIWSRNSVAVYVVIALLAITILFHVAILLGYSVARWFF